MIIDGRQQIGGSRTAATQEGDPRSVHEVEDPKVIGLGLFKLLAGTGRGLRGTQAGLLDVPSQGGLRDAPGGDVAGRDEQLAQLRDRQAGVLGQEGLDEPAEFGSDDAGVTAVGSGGGHQTLQTLTAVGSQPGLEGGLRVASGTQKGDRELLSGQLAEVGALTGGAWRTRAMMP